MLVITIYNLYKYKVGRFTCGFITVESVGQH